MLKAYAVAMALTTSAPVASVNEVSAQPVDNQPQKAEVQKGFKRGSELVLPSEASAKKGWRKRRGVIVLPQ